MFQLLIVDDEAHVVESLARTVPWHTVEIAEVHKAFSAGEAIEVLQQHPIDIVITDIQMPGMTGLDLAREIRRRWKQTRCILLSGHAEFQYAQEAISSGIADYLLKPVKDEQLLETIRGLTEKIRQEWEEMISRQKTDQTLREHLPLLRANLLNDLLQGRRFTPEGLREKMELLGIPVRLGEPFALLLVRLEEPFLGYDFRSLSLLEYAIGNMTEELLSGFRMWHCKDSHDYLVFAVQEEPASPGVSADGADGEHRESERQELLEEAASRLQHAVQTYLKGSVSVLVSRWGRFPDELTTLYRSSLSALRKTVGSEQQWFVRVSDESERIEVRSLQSLYEMPTLTHMFEAGRWDAAEARLDDIFAELELKWADSQEHLLEVYFAVSSAFAYIAHKNGKQLVRLIGDDYDRMAGGQPVRSLQQLREWTRRVLLRLREDMEQDTRTARQTVVEQVRRYIAENLSGDVSLQAIADHVYLHPVYVSKLYKLETGENLSDYVTRVKMERAAHLLKHSPEKVYEIAASLGYQRAHSFIHAFKRHYGLTPQEYRDKS